MKDDINKIVEGYFETVSSLETVNAIKYIIHKFEEYNFEIDTREDFRDIQFHEKFAKKKSLHPFAMIVNKKKGSLFYFRNTSIQKYNIDIDNLKTKANEISQNNKDEYKMRIINISDAELLINYIFKMTNTVYPDDIEDNNLYEGTKKQITVNAYERNYQARKECIQHYGYKCQICEFDFKKVYGEIGKDFIHVHHKVDISTIGENYKVNPIKDLIPVCPNCHAMLHKRKPAYNPEEIKSQILTRAYNKS